MSPSFRRSTVIVALLLSLFYVLSFVSIFWRVDTSSVPFREAPLIFVGGVPRSGTTLMRALLDAHPNIRCGEETRVIPNLLQIVHNWESGPYHQKLLENAGVTHDVLRDAAGAFVFEVIAKHGDWAPRLCNKDPLTFEHLPFLREIFPRARFVLMIRDGRAIVHSIISRKVPVVGFDWRKPVDCLKAWNKMIEKMYKDCKCLGPDVCLPVRYETLILRPEGELRRITAFLGESWSDNLLHHEKFVGSEIRLHPLEFSTSQVKKALNDDALHSWRNFYSDDILGQMDTVAPMLKTLGRMTQL
ncbi:hypothetical protein QR680_014911 [Steinernema hermaphroditum]|uniref:Protein-tyrosine sulfotransferase n=1 Tax=Steinernema hermaphroditum TaxID=289476 RepID=A0AA39M407_9BILA|nr:hypothetical protein QR680_014911 [Steinernema hermaphroditum]